MALILRTLTNQFFKFLAAATRTRWRWSWVCPRTVFKSSMRVMTPIAISRRSDGASGHGYNVARNPSQIFFTRVFNWSPWKKMMNTDLKTLSPYEHKWHECNKKKRERKKGLRHTFDGSSNGDSIWAWRRNTLPRHARHSIRSKAGKRSRKITPATKLFFFFFWYFGCKKVRIIYFDLALEKDEVLWNHWLLKDRWFCGLD